MGSTSLIRSWLGSIAVSTVVVLVLCTSVMRRVHAQGAADPRYQSRRSDCRHEPPSGRSLSIRRSDSGILARGYAVERVLNLAADARALHGGDIVVCTEYGRGDIADSDDDQVRLQLR